MLPWTIVRLSCSKHSLLLDYILPPLVGSWVPVAGSLAAGRLSAGSATKRTVGYQDAAWTQLPAAHGWKADNVVCSIEHAHLDRQRKGRSLGEAEEYEHFTIAQIVVYQVRRGSRSPRRVRNYLCVKRY